jgi:hypothetical protein
MGNKLKKSVSLFGINDCHKPKKIQKEVMNIEFVKYTNVQKL